MDHWNLHWKEDLQEQEVRDGLRFRNKERTKMRTIRDCSVCVVGGAGFLGSHLVNHLIEDRNCEVLVIDNLVAGRREFVHERASFLHHDITGSEELLAKEFRLRDVRFVFQYAAWPYVPDSFERPLHVFNVNAVGALKVINAAQEAGVEAILQVSSAEIYGEGTHGDYKIDETAEVVPHSSYGAAKAAIDAMVQVRWRESRTPMIALRQFNCLGPRETHPYIVPEIISQLALQQVDDLRDWGQRFKSGAGNVATVKLGNNSFRDFLYAGDAVRIAVDLLERGSFGEVYNLGSETGIKMYDLARMIGRLMGFADVRVEVDEARKRPWEIWSLLSDNTKIKNVCKQKEDLRPDQVGCLTPLETALKKTIAYYEASGRKWVWEK